MGPIDQRLPEPLQAELAVLKQALQDGKVTAPVLEAAIQKIAELPPMAVARLGRIHPPGGRLMRA